MTFSAFSTSRPAAGFPPRHFQPDSGRGRPGLPHHPFRGLIKCSLYCRDVLRCNLFLSRGFRAKLKVVGLWVLFWFQTSLFRAHSHAEAWARVFGPLVGTGENPNLPFLLLRWAWWPRPHAPLPAGHLLMLAALPGCGRCSPPLGTRRPDAASVQQQLPRGVKPQHPGLCLRQRPPPEDFSASCLVSAPLLPPSPLPFCPHYCFQT